MHEKVNRSVVVCLPQSQPQAPTPYSSVDQDRVKNSYVYEEMCKFSSFLVIMKPVWLLWWSCLSLCGHCSPGVVMRVTEKWMDYSKLPDI